MWCFFSLYSWGLTLIDLKWCPGFRGMYCHFDQDSYIKVSSFNCFRRFSSKRGSCIEFDWYSERKICQESRTGNHGMFVRWKLGFTRAQSCNDQLFLIGRMERGEQGTVETLKLGIFKMDILKWGM